MTFIGNQTVQMTAAEFWALEDYTGRRNDSRIEGATYRSNEQPPMMVKMVLDPQFDRITEAFYRVKLEAK